MKEKIEQIKKSSIVEIKKSETQKELAETKVKLLVQEGVVKELKQIISEKIAERDKSLVG